MLAVFAILTGMQAMDIGPCARPPALHPGLVPSPARSPVASPTGSIATLPHGPDDSATAPGVAKTRMTVDSSPVGTQTATAIMQQVAGASQLQAITPVKPGAPADSKCLLESESFQNPNSLYVDDNDEIRFKSVHRTNPLAGLATQNQQVAVHPDDLGYVEVDGIACTAEDGEVGQPRAEAVLSLPTEFAPNTFPRQKRSGFATSAHHQAATAVASSTPPARATPRAMRCLKVALRSGVRAAEDRIKQLEHRLAEQLSESSSQGSPVGNIDPGAALLAVPPTVTPPGQKDSADATCAANHNAAVSASDHPVSIRNEVLFAERQVSTFHDEESTTPQQRHAQRVKSRVKHRSPLRPSLPALGEDGPEPAIMLRSPATRIKRFRGAAADECGQECGPR